MGGTFDRLVSQGHDVHIAYQASGNVAVSDHDALKFIEVSNDMFPDELKPKVKELIKELKNKKTDKTDSIDVRKIKSLIRKREAISATRYIGIPDSNTHFMNLPFYETGRIKKNPASKKDVLLTAALIKKINGFPTCEINEKSILGVILLKSNQSLLDLRIRKKYEDYLLDIKG